jgi:TonB family protein
MRWLVLLLTCAAAQAQEPIRVGPGVTPPRVLSKVEPRYSGEGLRGMLEGGVLLKLVVSADGLPTNITVSRPLGLGLDEEAIRAVKVWRFQPGVKEGEAVPVIATIEVNFRVLRKGTAWSAHLAGANFDLPDGASRPVLLKTKPPRLPDSASGKWTLLFDVDESGSPKNVHAKDSDGSKLERDVIGALRDWKFAPAMKDGSQIRVSATFSFAAP